MSFNDALFGGELFGGSPVETGDLSSSRSSWPYLLELYDSSASNLKMRMTEWITASWTRSMNRPDTLDFTYPAAGHNIHLIVNPCLVVIKNSLRQVVSVFHIQKQVYTQNPQKEELRFNCIGVLAQLGKCLVQKYTSAIENEDPEQPSTFKTIEDIIEDLLGMQNNEHWRDISLGSIPHSMSSRSLCIEVTNKSVLQVLEELSGIIGGYFFVNAAFQLVWAPSEDKEHAIRAKQSVRLGANMLDFEETLDYWEIATEVKAIGKGLDDERPTGAAQANIEKYGTITKVLSFPNTEDVGLLEEAAEKELLICKEPIRTLGLSAIDLSKCTTSIDIIDRTYDIGPISIYHPRIGNVKTFIEQIQIELSQPQNIKLQLADPTIPKDELENLPLPRKKETNPDLIDRMVEIIKAVKDFKTGDLAFKSSLERVLGSGSFEDLLKTEDLGEALAEIAQDILDMDPSDLQELADALGVTLEELNQLLEARNLVSDLLGLAGTPSTTWDHLDALLRRTTSHAYQATQQNIRYAGFYIFQSLADMRNFVPDFSPAFAYVGQHHTDGCATYEWMGFTGRTMWRPLDGVWRVFESADRPPDEYVYPTDRMRWMTGPFKGRVYERNAENTGWQNANFLGSGY